MIDKTRMTIGRRDLLKVGVSGLALSMCPLWVREAAADCGTLNAGITGFNTINTLDPAHATLIPEYYVLWGVFNSLLKFDSEMRIVPDLAESYEVVSPMLLRFRLRQGVKFHDGVEMTAEDVKFTIERIKAEETGSPHRSKFDAVREVRVIDPYTVEVETDDPFAPLLSYFTNTRNGSQIVPKHLLENGASEDFMTSPVGTGPFRIVGFERGVSVRLEAFPDYFEAGKPAPAAVNIPLIAEESAGVTALLGGTIDITSTAPFADIPQLEQDPRVKVLKSPGVNTRFVHLNNRIAPFDDVHFRRAVSMAFDKQAMADVVVFGEGRAANGVIPSSIAWASQPEKSDLLRFDPEAAKAEMAKSKYGPGVEATVLTWGSSWWKRFAEVFVLQVNQVLGTRFKVEVSESGAVYQRLQAGDFQASIWGWLGLVDPDEYAFEILHSTGWRNYGGYANPEVDALLEQARRELDQEARGALYRKAETLMLEDMPLLPCFESNVHNLLARDVEGFEQLPYSAFGSQLAAVTAC